MVVLRQIGSADGRFISYATMVKADAVIDPLSPKLVARIHQFFPESADEVIALLQGECGSDLPLAGQKDVLRIQCAVLKLSNGTMEKLRTGIREANIDWRDVLMAAGFGPNVTAHVTWLDKP